MSGTNHATAPAASHHEQLDPLVRFRDLFHVLSPRQRDIAERLLGGAREVEIARALRCSKPTVTIALQRARARLHRERGLPPPPRPGAGGGLMSAGPGNFDARRLRATLSVLGLNMSDVAVAADCSPTSIASLLRGERHPKPVLAARLRPLFGDAAWSWINRQVDSVEIVAGPDGLRLVYAPATPATTTSSSSPTEASANEASAAAA